MNFSWGQKVAALGGQEGATKRQEGCALGGKNAPHPSHLHTLPAKEERCAVRTWGQEGGAPAFFGTNLEVFGVSRSL